MTDTRATRLDPPVDPAHDHVLGNPDAQITLVEYGSYVCTYCRTAHEVIRHLRDEFGDDPDPDEVYRYVTGVMQDTLDALAAERRFPVIG